MGELEINKAGDITLLNDSSTNKPTAEDIERIKLEFEDSAKEFSERLWKIAEPGEVQKTVDYLDDFVKNKAVWAKDAWMGLIKLNEVIEDIKTDIDYFKELKVTYQALEFITYILQNGIGGVGIQSALDFETVAEQHAAVLEKAAESVTAAREEIKEVQFKQDRWVAAEQGFFLEREDLRKNIEEEEAEIAAMQAGENKEETPVSE